MSRVRRPLFSEELLGVNPFRGSLDVPVIRHVSSHEFKRDGDGDFVNVERDFEYTPFTKLYTQSDLRKHTALLSPRGCSLLLWIMYSLKPGKDFLWINKQRYREESKVNSVNTYMSALRELIRYGYLSSTTVGDVFWVNPAFFFNGDRPKKFRDRVRYVSGNDGLVDDES